jgi:cytidylate kinase
MTTVALNKKNIVPQAETDNPEKRKMVIAVDGPAASGKGTLAKMMADRLGYAYLDTGALYRAVALATLELGGNPEKYADVAPALAMVKRNLTPELLANPALRSHDVSEASSRVSALPEVRSALIDYQRAFARNLPDGVGGAVLDGRDIGTVICPGADLKFFVTATPEVRARRRYEELKTRAQGLTLEKVLSDIQQRDQRDSTRKVAPALAANDAHILDTTNLNRSETLQKAVEIIHSKLLSESGANAAGH